MISTKGRYALRVMLDLAQYGQRQTIVSSGGAARTRSSMNVGGRKIGASCACPRTRSSMNVGERTESMDETSMTERGSFIPLDEIAERQGISKKYLEIILKVLVQHKLLKGLRGKGGGYKLTRPPKDYTVGEILTLTEGNLAIVSCLLDDDAPCMRKSECLTLPMWEKFDRMTHDFFFGITLADLMKGEIPT